jgi:hypothetical protein
MRLPPAKSIPWTILTLVPMAAVLFSTAATAATEPTQGVAGPASGEGGVGSPGKPENPKPDETSSAAADTKSPPPTVGDGAVTPSPSSSSWAVERLPGSAFPRPTPPGIYGGSLWLEPAAWASQWPYIPKTGIGFSGSAWVDTGYEQIKRGSNRPNTVYWLQEGRAVLRATPTYSDGRYFVQAQAELVANKDQTVSQVGGGVVDTDDLWVKVGQWRAWDVQVGRFEAWELNHLGMGLDLNTLERKGAADDDGSLHPPDPYLVSYAFYRPGSVGNVALHAFPVNFARIELLGQVGNEQGLNTIGGRPSVAVDIWKFRIRAGGEYRRSTARQTTVVSTPVLDAMGQPILNPDLSPMVLITKPDGKQKNIQRGFGGSLQFILDPYFEIGINAAQGLVDAYDQNGGFNTEGSYTVTTLGGFANARIIPNLLVGVGVDRTTLVNQHVETLPDQTTHSGHFAHLQSFVAVQYLVFGQLYLKAVGGYAKGDLEPSFANGLKYSNTMISGRVRLMYLF